MRWNTKLWIGVVVVISLVTGNAMAQTGAVASVNGTKITAKELDAAVKGAVQNGAKESPELRQALMNDLVIRESILQDVKKTGMDKKGDNPERIRIAQQNILMDLWFSEYLKAHPITDAEIKADYDRQAALTKDGRNSNEYKFSQIVVATEADANDVIAKINGGASFEKLAKDRSLDKSTGAEGGSIGGYVVPDMLMPALGDALISAPKGKVDLKPIKSNLGWHVIRVDDVRKFKLPGFDEAKNNIAQGLLAKRRQDAVGELMKRTKIEKLN